MIAALDIVKKLQNGQSMRDLMTKTNLVMMAEPETYVETEKGINPVQSKLYQYKRASLLAQITIFYNLIEGIVSVFFGVADETLSLFGFGIDSFVEVLSGIGIWNMVRRMRLNPNADAGLFEKRALRITGTAFYILAVGLVITAGITLYQGHRPETTFWGIIIAAISIFTMWALIYFKVKVGRQLNSDAIMEDANCTKACLYLSFTLLLASAGFELTGIGGIDSIGAIVIAIFSFREGKESFEKARVETCRCDPSKSS